MQITKENIKQEIDRLDDAQLKQISDFIEFIKFRNQFQQKTPDLHQFAHLYQEFAREDRDLAEAGIADYNDRLQQEDRI